MPVDMNSVTTNDCRQLEVSFCCRAGVLPFGTACFEAPSAGGYKWQYILTATFLVVAMKYLVVVCLYCQISSRLRW